MQLLQQQFEDEKTGPVVEPITYSKYTRQTASGACTRPEFLRSVGEGEGVDVGVGEGVGKGAGKGRSAEGVGRYMGNR
jgi:hypothetical protein